MVNAESNLSGHAVEESSGGFLRWLGYGFLFLICLILFTLVKLPQPKIHAWVLGTINQQTAPMGIQVSADEGRIALGLGLQYEMTGVRLTKVATQKSLIFSRLEVSPNLIGPLLQKKLGGSFKLEEGAGHISGNIMAGQEDFDAKIQIEGVNLGRMGILPFAAGLEGTSDIRGTIELAGAPNQLTAMNGQVKLNLSKLVIDSQKLMGFDIPRTAVGEAVMDIAIGSGKAAITTFRVGKAGGTDDLFADLTGEIRLNRIIEQSDANLRLKFGFSDRYKQEKTIALVDSLISAFKRQDGAFGMRLSGPLYAIVPSPDP